MSIQRLLRGRASWAGAGALSLAACAVALAGCGSSSVANVVDPVAQAATISTNTSGYRVNLAMTMTDPALSTPITATGQGAFDVPAHAGVFTISLNFGNSPQIAQVLGGSTLRMEELIKGQTFYMKLPPAITSKVPTFGSKPWLELNLAQLAASSGVPGLGSLASNPTTENPSELLNFLRAASGKVITVGTAQVNGVHTTEYRGSINLDRVPDAMPAASRPAARQAIQSLERVTSLRELPFEVWVDGQHLVRRLALTFSETVSGQTVTASMRLDIPEYGPQSVPAAPPAGQVTNLNALTGGGS